MPGSIDSVQHNEDNIPSQNLKVEDISDAPPEKVNPEALLSSDITSASSNMASTTTDMTSASSDQKDRGTEEWQEEHLLKLLQEKMQKVDSLKQELERVNKENKLLSALLKSKECLEEKVKNVCSTSQKE